MYAAALDPVILTLTPFVVRHSSSAGGADSFDTHASFPMETASSMIVETVIVASAPFALSVVVAYVPLAAYPVPPDTSSTDVIVPA